MGLSKKGIFRKVAFGERLAQARMHRQLSQEALAESIGATARTIGRWEHDLSLPQQYYRERLCEVLQITPEVLFGANETVQQSDTQTTFLWHVPYARNPYFTGREAVLHQIHEKWHSERQADLSRPQILTGLGGIGKTQIALEYAYRFRCDYQAVLWVNAEACENLMSDCLTLAQLFQPRETYCSDYALARATVKHWLLSHTGWLLIFDNVEDLALLQAVLSDTSQGHILITTRSQIIGTLGYSIDLHKMEQAEGVLFLLQRAKILSLSEPLKQVPASLLAQAETVVELLDGLPLALDQAAAYIEETACSISDYLEHYTTQRNALLNNRGTTYSPHPASVAATLSLSFQRVEQTSPLAADLLRLCAFLPTPAIPEEFIVQLGKMLGPTLQQLSANPLALNAAIRELRRFSLLHREPETRTLRIHRLLQVIIYDEMGEDARKQWIECIIQATPKLSPEYRDIMFRSIETLSHYQPFLSHVSISPLVLEKDVS